MSLAPAPLRDLQTSQAARRAAENDVRSAQTSLGGDAQSFAHSRHDRRGDHEIQRDGRGQPAYDDLFADCRHGHPAQGRSWSIHQHVIAEHERQRSDVRHRRSVDRLARRLCARDRGTECPCRPGRCISRSWPIRNRLSRRTSPMSRRRSMPPRDGLLVRATIDNSEGLLRPEMFASVNNSHRRGRQFAGGAARCDHLRRKIHPCLGRTKRSIRRTAGDQDRTHQRPDGPGRSMACARREGRQQGQAVRRPRCRRKLTPPCCAI